MTGLAALLAGHNPPDVYTWHNAAHVPDVQHAVEHAGWRFLHLDTWTVEDPASFLIAAERALGSDDGRVPSFDALSDQLAELDAPDRALIKAHGQAPGSAVDATAEMHLSDGDGGTTVMDWNADVNLSGTLASVGARLIEGTANKMIAQTFDCMRAKLEA